MKGLRVEDGREILKMWESDVLPLAIDTSYGGAGAAGKKRGDFDLSIRYFP